MARFVNSTFVVHGATGNVGRGVAKAALDEGAKVAIVGRERAKLDAIKKDYLGNSDQVFCIAQDCTTSEGAGRAKDQALKALGKIDNVFMSSGPWWFVSNNMSEVSSKDFEAAVQSNIAAHFYVWNAFFPVVKSAYVSVNGSAADGLPHTGLTGFCAHSVAGLCKLFDSEARSKKILYKEIHLGARVADDEVQKGAWPSVKFGKKALDYFDLTNSKSTGSYRVIMQ